METMLKPAWTRVGPYMNPDRMMRWLAERAEQKLYATLAAERGMALAFFERWGVYPIAGGATAAAYDVVNSAAFALVAGAKTAVNIIAPAGHGLTLCEIGTSFDGVTSSAVPALVEVVRSTQATAGTPGAAPTITQVRGHATSGSAPTAGGAYSAEPTVLTRLKAWYVPQFMGTYTYQFPLGREVECDASGGTNLSLGVRINVSANVNGMSYGEVEALG